MKQAILITAYKDFNQLKRMIMMFDASFNVYVSIDKKSKCSQSDLKELMKLNNVKHLSTNYKVNWGGFNHLNSYLNLCKVALRDKENYYFHLITGQDIPI